MNLFFDPNVATNVNQFLLNADETHHALKVLRLRSGDEIYITNGKGSIFKGLLMAVAGKEAQIGNLRLEQQQERHYNIHLALSPVKNLSRVEWLLEKATEIGVSEISFVNCQRTQRSRLRPDRLHKIVVEAMKQSMNAFLPAINEIMPLENYLEREHPEQCFIAHCETGTEQHLARQYKKGKDVTLLIGPEGDFTPDEVALACAKGFAEVSLGDTRLRTETAAFMAVAAVHVLNRQM
ncbi:MAG: 16S rRNA (uracil(1498)-N(3))-methyltransferase [Bacteroidia bacterium]